METSAAQAIKLAIVSATALSKDALHVYVGLSVFLPSALILRRPLRSPLPWLAALLVAALGEIVDMRDDISSLGYWRWAASAHDMVNTIFWPTVLLCLARFTRFLGAPYRL
jgi:hypothetical protein